MLAGTRLRRLRPRLVAPGRCHSGPPRQRRRAMRPAAARPRRRCRSAATGTTITLTPSGTSRAIRRPQVGVHDERLRGAVAQYVCDLLAAPMPVDRHGFSRPAAPSRSSPPRTRSSCAAAARRGRRRRRPARTVPGSRAWRARTAPRRSTKRAPQRPDRTALQRLGHQRGRLFCKRLAQRRPRAASAGRSASSAPYHQKYPPM